MTRIGSHSDPTSHSRPNLDGRLSVEEVEALFFHNDIARRVVEEIVHDAFRPGLPPLQSIKSQERVKCSFQKEQEILDQVKEAAINARLYGGGHIMVVVKDGKLLSQPLDWEAATLPELQGTFVLDKAEATPTRWGTDPRSPRYMEPTHYAVNPSGSGGTTVDFPEVHYTRLLSFRGARLPRKLRRYVSDYDDSVLQQVWVALRNFYHSEQSIVNIISRFETATISIAGLKDILAAEEGAQLIQERMELMHQTLAILNAALVDADAGESYERRFATVTGLDTLWDRLALSVAKAARMPKSQLFGDGNSGIRGDDEAGGKGWRKQVEEYRREELLSPLIRLLSLVHGEHLEPVVGRHGQPLWGNAEPPKPVDEARIAEMESRAYSSDIEAGIITPDEARKLKSGQSINWEDPAPGPQTPEPVAPLDEDEDEEEANETTDD